MNGRDPALDPHGLRKRFLSALYESIRAVRIHSIKTTAEWRALEALSAVGSEILEEDRTFEFRLNGQRLYLNARRLHLDIENFSSFGLVVATLQQAGVGWIRMEEPAGSREWKTIVSELLSFGVREDTPDGTEELRGLPRDQGLSHLTVGPPLEGDAQLPNEFERKKAARHTYEQSVAVATDLFGGTMLGPSAHLKQMKQAVRNIVDQVLNNEVTSVGLTTLNDYDRYTFVHTVNVCIFSVAIGRRLGLTKTRLFDLGMAALLHDVGKSRIPLEIVTKKGKLTEEEHTKMQAHTWLGALSAYEYRDYGEIPFRGMITAYEHHMKVDLSGYPKAIRPRTMSMFSKIISLASVFDAATSAHNYSEAESPDAVLRDLWEKPELGHDPVLVKALISLLGIYPVGTCVILDTHELAIVHAANSDATQVHRPVVRLICNTMGFWIDQPPLVDLAETGPDGAFKRSIIKVTDPKKYMINVSDYIV
jgi:HD-GYP domain-containing protein (c-di-GMP phosphodiesterase class II)